MLAIAENNMPQPKSEIDEFFDGLPSEDKKESVDDIFKEEPAEKSETSEEEANKGGEDKPEKDEEPRKNRRHRRLEQQLQTEREARIRAEARAEAAAQYGEKPSVNSGDVDPRWLRIYGDTPEAREAWRLQQEIFNDYKTQTKAEALRELEQQRAEALRVERENEELIGSELESLEDEYNVDLTSDAPAARKARREFLAMVEKASPKDEDGNVISYADFGTIYEFYVDKQAKGKESNGTTTRQKEISSRTMNKSNSSSASNPTVTPGFDGWRKDYNLD